MEGQRLAYAYAISAVMLWSTVATVFKLALREVHPLQLLFFSSVVSAAVLLIASLMGKKTRLLGSYTFRDFLYSAFLGLLNPFLYYLVLFRAYDILPAQEAQTLNYTWPLTLVLLSIPLLKQKIGGRDVLAVLISFFGVVVIGTRGNLTSLRFDQPLGVVLAVGSSLIWALFWIYNLRDERDATLKLFLNFVFGSVFALIAVLLTSHTRVAPSYGLLWLVYVGLFEMGVTFVLWLKGLELSENTAKVSNLIFLAPFVSLVLIHIVLGERILVSTLIGLGFIIGGIALQRFKGKGEDIADQGS